MPYCTDTDVRSIIDPVLVQNLNNLTPFIDAADQVVLQLQSLSQMPNYSAALLRQIEMWLAAHFIAIRTRLTTGERMGDKSASFALVPGLNLGATTYGQQAQLIDVFGGLAWLDKHISQGKRTKAGVSWLGRPNRFEETTVWRFFDLFCSDP